MAQVKAIQTEQNLTDGQTDAFRRQLEQMEQLSQRQQEQIRSCREFLAERDLLGEYESRYGTLTVVEAEEIKEREEVQETKTETPEQTEEKNMKTAKKKVLKI